MEAIKEESGMQISLKAARVNANLTQKQAANGIGVDVSTISSWESGKTSPKAVSLEALCHLYGVTVDSIFLSDKSS